MKKFSFFLCLCLLLLPAVPAHAAALAAEDIISDSAILIDAATGQVLYEKNGSKRMYPASTTKIMTALLAVENTRPYELATVSESAIAIAEPDSANVALRPGERVPIESAIYALMLPSANDAANVLAEYIAGSQENFSKLMNEKAARIGAENTHFTNAHGLHDPDHYTTASDMAMITRYAMRNADFAQYFGTSHYTMAPTNLQPQERPFTNYQYMLVSTTDLYNPAVIGGKVGYTGEAQHTMATVATKNGRTLICVVMHSPHRLNKFSDTEKLLDYGFEGFYTYTIPSRDFSERAVPIGAGGNPRGSASFRLSEDVTLLLPNDVTPFDLQVDYNLPASLESEEEAAGSVSLRLRASTARTLPPILLDIPLEASVEMDSVPAAATLSSTLNASGSAVSSMLGRVFSHTAAWIALVLAGVLLLFILTAAARNHSLKKRRRQREARLARRSRANAPVYKPVPRASRVDIYSANRYR